MALWRYLIRRLLYTLATVFGALTVMFILTRVLPGDPARMMLGPGQSSPEEIATVRDLMGLDRSIPVQFLQYLGHLLKGELGVSRHAGNPVSHDLITRFPATFELTTFAFILMVLFGLPLGLISGCYRNKAPDHMIRVFTLMGLSMPIFWIGLLLVYVFFYKLGLAPSPMGRLPPNMAMPPHITGLLLIDASLAGNLKAFLRALEQLLLPGVTLAFFHLAIFVRTLKADLIETLEKDYIRTARAMGIDQKTVLWRHAFRNALIPSVTRIGKIYGSLLGGAVLTEVVFSWPGLGLYAVESIQYPDYAGLQGVILFYVIIFALVNLLVGLAHRWIDPRISAD